MNGFAGILGHEQLREHLSRSLKEGRISHAYLFSGADGIGKNMLADAFARALVCEAGYGDSCSMCRSCRQFDAGTHPDVRRIVHEKPRLISVDEIRKQLVRDIPVKPYQSRYKVYIIDDADLMNEQAQNSLLKTLEEPPSYGVILLLTANTDALLPTLRSRCLNMEMRAVPREQLVSWLEKEYEMPDYQAGICAAFSQGSPGKAAAIASSGRFSELNEYMLEFLKKSADMDVYEIVAKIHDISRKYKDDIYDLLDLMEVWYHDVLILKATGDMNQIVYKQEYRFLNRKAIKSSYQGLEEIIEAIARARKRLRANVNFDTTMELLVLTIMEN